MIFNMKTYEIEEISTKIVINGTSASGALFALKENYPNYLPCLREITTDDANNADFDANCHWPVTNLDHANMDYERQFQCINECYCKYMRWDEDSRSAFSDEDGHIYGTQILAYQAPDRGQRKVYCADWKELETAIGKKYPPYETELSSRPPLQVGTLSRGQVPSQGKWRRLLNASMRSCHGIF